MAIEDFKRKLTAILSADVQGYSRLMGEDDEATVRTITAYREVIIEVVQKHRGRVVDSPGDNILAEFASVIDAVRSAVEIQQELKTKNAELPEEPSIAVLPFDNLSGDPEQEYFSDGITEEIISALSKNPKIFVIARNSTFTYKGKPVKVQQVSEELGVRYVLEGSVRKSGDEIRVTAQLIDALAGHHLWAERYDRNMRKRYALILSRRICTCGV